MQQNFIRKLDQQIEKTEEDKNVQEKCREDQREQEETFDLGGVSTHGAMKKQQKNKPGRGVAPASYFGADVGYGSMGGLGLEKQGKGAGGFELGAFDSDALGKFGGSNNLSGIGGMPKKNRGTIDSQFKADAFGSLGRRGAQNALDLMETSSANGDRMITQWQSSTSQNFGGLG